MQLWHGSPFLFSRFSTEHFGKGEGGDGMGFGVYLAENRKGGEYFAEYASKTKSAGFLYAVEFAITPRQTLVLTNSPTSQPNYMEWSRYSELRESLGDTEFSRRLSEKGIAAVRGYEETKPGHGDTVLCLVPSLLSIQQAWRFSRDPYGWHSASGPA